MHVKLTLGIVDFKNAYRCHLTRTAEHDREFDCRHQEHLSEPKKKKTVRWRDDNLQEGRDSWPSTYR
jgi:hypothetical protein